MTFETILRSALRMDWRLSPQCITALAGGVTWRAWAVATTAEQFVVQLVCTSDQGYVQAGLAAAEHLRAHGIDAGVPVRSRSGALTVATPAGALAVLRQVPGRPLAGSDPIDQHWWGDLLGRAHRALDGFEHAGLRRWHWLRADAGHLGLEPWLRPAVAEAVALMTRLAVTDRLTYGVVHGDPAPAGFLVDVDTGRTGMAGWGPAAAGPLVYDLASAVSYAGGPAVAADLIDGYVAAGPVTRGEIEAALPVLVRFRLAVEADWFCQRIANDDLAGDADPAANLAGLHRVRDALAACAADGG